MKKLSIVILFFLACNKAEILVQEPQSCGFNLTEYNLTKRTLSGVDAAGANKPTIEPSARGGNSGRGWGCILLDFDGHYVENTSWNHSGPFMCQPANLTAAQVDEIVANVVGEYTNYKVRVTTDERIYNRTDPNKRIRLVLTETWEWFGQAGGVAFIGSYSWGDNTPCFVFTSLLNYSTKFIKEASAHEVGHTAGLYHQSTYDTNCVKTSEYNGGNGVECPIMGLPFYTPDPGTKWWVGPNTFGCNSIQDDNGILTQILGQR